jgi:hypothetical protein
VAESVEHAAAVPAHGEYVQPAVSSQSTCINVLQASGVPWHLGVWDGSQLHPLSA